MSDSLEQTEPLWDEAAGPSQAFRVALPNFEGPLDLLLHLLREHKLDILDIPVALITEKYLESLDRMREVNLDIAGEFLVMAATLAHLKSRMLVPREEVASQLDPVEEVADPRAALVRRLLDYQRYKAAGQQLSARPVLGRDVFARRLTAPADRARDVAYLEVSVYRLIEALDRVIQAAAPEIAHEVMRERLSLTQAMVGIAHKVREAGKITFVQLFAQERSRARIVVTFLALLEMCKRRWLRLSQSQDEAGTDAALGEIWVEGQGLSLEGLELPEVDEHEYR